MLMEGNVITASSQVEEKNILTLYRKLDNDVSGLRILIELSAQIIETLNDPFGPTMGEKDSTKQQEDGKPRNFVDMFDDTINEINEIKDIVEKNLVYIRDVIGK